MSSDRASGCILALWLLGGVLATGCRPNEETPGETPDAGPTWSDAGTTGPDAGTPGPDAGTELARVQVGEPKPNLMLLVDTSGSMTQPINPSLPGCKVGGKMCGTWETDCDTRVCPTRWSEVQAAMERFLASDTAARARLGLATYPSSIDAYGCGPSIALSSELPPADKDDPATLQQKAQDVRNKLLAINNSQSAPLHPQGGTPTSHSLQFLGSRPELQTETREDIVLLLTDGLPICNEAYPNPYPSPGCFCVLTSCSFDPATAIGCLDKEPSVAAVASLRAKDIKTFVVGFGTDFIAHTEAGRRGAETLNAMAEQGGFARACTSNADCAEGDTCDTDAKLCTRRFYAATNANELTSALQLMGDRLPRASCLVRFEAAGDSTQESLEVSLEGQVLAPGPDSWSLTSEGVLFTGTPCQRLQEATPAEPMLVVVRTAGT